MPTYEYVCKACGEHLEVVQAFSDPPMSACPACGGALRKVFGNVGIVFKGSGFYKTDSRSSSTASAPAKGDGGSSGEAASAPAKEPATTSSGSTAPGSTTPAGAGSGSGSASPSTPSAAAG